MHPITNNANTFVTKSLTHSQKHAKSNLFAILRFYYYKLFYNTIKSIANILCRDYVQETYADSSKYQKYEKNDERRKRRRKKNRLLP